MAHKGAIKPNSLNDMVRGYFSGSYQIRSQPYTKPVESPTCFVFAGQGAVYPGMFRDFFTRFDSFRKWFDKGDTLAQKRGLPPLSRYVTAPDSLSEQDQYRVQNLCLFVGEVAQFYLLKENGITPRSITSHSFGEYAALVCAEVVSFEAMFSLVAFREHSSPPKNTAGFLVAVNTDADTAKSILKNHPIYIANLNSAEQTIVAVAPQHVDALEQFLKEKGIRKKRLPTPQPYHSPLLSEMPAKMKKYLQKNAQKLSSPKIPVLSSVTHQWFTKDQFTKVIENQMTEPVHFIDQTKAVVEHGATQFIELGPAPILSPLMPLNTGFAANRSLFVGQYFESFKKGNREKTARTKGSKWIKAVNRVISSVTGYQIEDIALEDKFQEDLGIDSIKKTEIIFSVLDETKSSIEGVNTASIQNVGDLLKLVQSEPTQLSKRETQFALCEISWKKAPLVASQSKTTKYTKIKLELDSLPKLALSGKKPLVLHCQVTGADWNKLSTEQLRQKLQKKLIPFLKNLQKTIQKKQLAPHILLVTESHDPFWNALTALLKCVSKESSNLFIKHIHFADGFSEALVEQELSDGTAIDVLYKGGDRFVGHLSRRKTSPTSTVTSESVIFAIGGAKGITHSLLKGLCKNNTPKIYVAGRSPKEKLNVALKEIQAIEYFQLDATNPKAIKSAIDSICEREGSIDFVFNGAGVELSQRLEQKESSDMERELFNKTLPSFALCKALATTQTRLINFSSIVAWYGNHGQSLYAWANRFIECLSEQAPLTAQALAWPPWDGVGMTADRAILGSLKSLGVSLLSPEKADSLFAMALGLKDHAPVYIHDAQDHFAYGLPLKGAELSKMLGRASLSPQSLRFEREISLESDPYLNDHVVEGVSYLPGAVGSALMLASLRQVFGYLPSLHQIRFLQPITIKEASHTPLYIELDRLDPSVSMGSTNQAFLASWDNKKATPPSPAESPGKAIPTQGLYGPEGLFHGDSFQLIASAQHLSTRGLSIELRTDAPPILDQSPFGCLAQLLDAAFQGASLLVIQSKPGLWLPTGVKRLSVLPQFHLEASFIQIRLLQETDRGLIASAVAYAKDKTPLAVFEEFELRHIR